ncbi:hypothetical protein [Ferrimicrobium sp.]|uniref:hypothetical protein n=1 Tax=Ferrimicrobium sp. TaxID=2926050 RepID=UPI00261E6948|nr:hypothetical protein [Ferrimicrobium sp.]
MESIALERVIERSFGAFSSLPSRRDGWRVVRTRQGLVCWPTPLPGAQFAPISELLGQVLAVRRFDAHSPMTVVWPLSLGLAQNDVLIQVAEFDSVFVRSVPPIRVRKMEGTSLGSFDTAGTRALITPRVVPEELRTIASGAFDGLGEPEYAWYQGGVFAEYLGVPVIGMIGDVLVAGVDPRDQAMAREAEMNPEQLRSFAREIVGILVASRFGRRGRYDFSRVAVGRLMRSLFCREHRRAQPIEFAQVAQGRARAYAAMNDSLYGFGGANDLWLVLEAAAFSRLVPGTQATVYVLDTEPMMVFEELARLVAMPYSIEVREPVDG